MNDRFKFRIVVYERNDYKSPWFFVELIEDDNNYLISSSSGHVCHSSTYSAFENRTTATDNMHRVYESEQCTGLKDKNGKLIYEGDIVQPRLLEYCHTESLKVYWDKELLSWCLKTRGSDSDNCSFVYELEKISKGCEIIGNIHTQEGE